jgi:hypothetical protein
MESSGQFQGSPSGGEQAIWFLIPSRLKCSGQATLAARMEQLRLVAILKAGEIPMAADDKRSNEPSSEAAEPSPGEASSSEREFLRKVRRNIELDVADDLDGPKAQTDRAKRGTVPKRDE